MTFNHGVYCASDARKTDCFRANRLIRVVSVKCLRSIPSICFYGMLLCIQQSQIRTPTIGVEPLNREALKAYVVVVVSNGILMRCQHVR